MYMLQTTVCPNIHSYGARSGYPYRTAYTVRNSHRTVTPKHTRILSCDRRLGCPYRKCTCCKRAICIPRNANGAMQMTQRKGLGLGFGLWSRLGSGLGLGAHELWNTDVNALCHLHCAICIAPNTERLANEGYSQTLNIHSHVGCCVYV